MSLYRQAGARGRASIAVALVAGLLLGAVAGLLIAGAADDEPSLEEQIASLRERARAVSSALDLVVIEYGDSVEGGRVVAPTEYRAAVDSAARARQSYDEIRADVETLNRSGSVRVERSLARVAELVNRKADRASVEGASTAAAAELRAAVGGGG